MSKQPFAEYSVVSHSPLQGLQSLQSDFHRLPDSDNIAARHHAAASTRIAVHRRLAACTTVM